MPNERQPLRFGFPAECRLLRPVDYQRVYGRRCSVSNAWLSLAGCPNDLPHSRLGISVSRKVGSAVKRNRWKRMVREVFRLTRTTWPSGIDFVVIPRQAEPPAFLELQAELLQLAQQLQRRLQQGRTTDRRRGSS